MPLQAVQLVLALWGLLVIGAICLGILLARLRGVREKSLTLGASFCLLLAALLPSIAAIVQFETFAWQRADGKFVSADNVEDGHEAKTKQTVTPTRIPYADTVWDTDVLVLRHDEKVRVWQDYSFDLYRWRDPFRLGDGTDAGTYLIYQFAKDKPLTDNAYEKTIGDLRQRVKFSGVDDVSVRAVSGKRVEVHVGALDSDSVAAVKEAVTYEVNLELSIVANATDHSDILKRSRALDPAEKEVRDANNVVVAHWLPVWVEFDNHGQVLPGNGEFSPNDERFAIRQIQNLPPGSYEVLVLQDHPDEQLTGEFVSNARCMVFEGEPQVMFHLNYEGAQRFESLTRRNKSSSAVERRLAIVVNGIVCSAPAVRAVISESGVITGLRSREKTEQLAAILDSGPLPAELSKEPVEEYTVKPTVSADSRQTARLSLSLAGITGVLALALLISRGSIGKRGVLEERALDSDLK